MSQDSGQSVDFLRNLNEEKLLHKGHRDAFVKHKLIFIISLFGIGSIEMPELLGTSIRILPLNDLLLFIPVVALTFDIFISAEDFKVKRIGVFLRENAITSKEEQQWEEWLTLPKHRESTALFGSITITIVAFLVSFLMLSKAIGTNGAFARQDLASSSSVVFSWFLVCAIATGYVFEEIQYRRNALVQPIRNRSSSHFVWAISLMTVSFFGLTIWVITSSNDHLLAVALDLPNSNYTSSCIAIFSAIALYTISIKRVTREVFLRIRRNFSEVTFAVSKDDLRSVEKRMNSKVRDLYLCGNFSRWQFNSIKLEELPSSHRNAFECRIPLEAGQTLDYKYQAFSSDGLEFWFCEDSIEGKKLAKDKLGYDINRIKIRETQWPRLPWFAKLVRDVYVKQEALRSG